MAEKMLSIKEKKEIKLNIFFADQQKMEEIGHNSPEPTFPYVFDSAKDLLWVFFGGAFCFLAGMASIAKFLVDAVFFQYAGLHYVYLFGGLLAVLLAVTCLVLAFSSLFASAVEGMQMYEAKSQQ